MRKLFKKSLACVLAVALCLTAMVGALTVSATEPIAGTITATDAVIESGATSVTIPVTFTVEGEGNLLSEGFIDVSVTEGASISGIARPEDATDYFVDVHPAKSRFEIYTKGASGVDSAKVNIEVAINDIKKAPFTLTLTDYTSATASEVIVEFGTKKVAITCEHANTTTADVVTHEATCTTAGSKTVTTTCDDCKKVISTEEDVVIPATGHSHTSVVTAPTCTEAGYTTYTCACGDTYTADEVPATGHNYGDGVITTAPDCENAGVKTYTCATCGDTYTEAIAATGHTAAEAVIENNVAATCTVDGSYDTVVYCTVCDAQISRETTVVEATGHDYDAVVTAPTCTEAGYTTYTCACGDTYTADEVAATGHNYVEGTCSNCGEADPDYVAPCDHIDANQDGICDNGCGYENLDESLTFYTKSMLLGADIRGIFQVRKYKSNSPYDSFKVIVEKGDVKSELELVATSDKTNYTTYGYAITVPAKEMADIINARIVGITADGEAFISNVETWSIKEGLIKIMDTDGTSEDRMKLCANMLNYGAEAQKKFGYNLDNLATDGLSEKNAAYIITTTPAMSEIPAIDDSDATVRLKDISFNLAARVQILPRFTVPKADSKDSYKAEITKVHVASDGTETTSSFTVEGDKILKSANSTTLAVYIDDLASKELRDVLTVTLYKDDVVVSATHTFSAESALASKFDTNSALITALMNYGDCARAVFG